MAARNDTLFGGIGDDGLNAGRRRQPLRRDGNDSVSAAPAMIGSMAARAATSSLVNRR